jgi:hypothetical protein
VEVARVTVVLATETFAQEAAAAWDSIIVCFRDMEDWTSLAERDYWERVSRVEAENAVALGSAHDDTKGLVWQVALLEGEFAEVR